MPIYSYRSADGQEVERIFSYAERPDFFIDEETHITYFYRIAPIARMTDTWRTFSTDGVNGRWNETLGTSITNMREHDQLCDKRGIRPATDTDMEKLTSQRAESHAASKRRFKQREDFQRELKEHGNVAVANERVYGTEEKQIAQRSKQEPVKKEIAEKAKHIKWKELETKP